MCTSVKSIYDEDVCPNCKRSGKVRRGSVKTDQPQHYEDKKPVMWVADLGDTEVSFLIPFDSPNRVLKPEV